MEHNIAFRTEIVRLLTVVVLLASSLGIEYVICHSVDPVQNPWAVLVFVFWGVADIFRALVLQWEPLCVCSHEVSETGQWLDVFRHGVEEHLSPSVFFGDILSSSESILPRRGLSLIGVVEEGVCVLRGGDLLVDMLVRVRCNLLHKLPLLYGVTAAAPKWWDWTVLVEWAISARSRPHRCWSHEGVERREVFFGWVSASEGCQLCVTYMVAPVLAEACVCGLIEHEVLRLDDHEHH